MDNEIKKNELIEVSEEKIKKILLSPQCSGNRIENIYTVSTAADFVDYSCCYNQ